MYRSMKKVLNKNKFLIIVLIVISFFGNKVNALTNEEKLEKTYPLMVTNRNFSNFSQNKNFIIFLIDCVDSKKFNKVLNNSIYKNSFKDFTYFPDTTSYYLYTRESIPLILTGIPNYNEDDYNTYYNKAFDNSLLINELKNKNYEINIYDHELKWTTKNVNIIQNVDNLSNQTGFIYNAKCALQKLGNSYFPFIFNIFPSLKNLNCNNTTEIDYSNIYSWDDIDSYNLILNSVVTKTDKNQFKFIHVNGSHAPYNIDAELNRVSENKSSYETEILASIKLVNTYIDLLKRNNLYDNTAFIIMADHGYAFEERIGRQNPVFLVKGINENHDKMNISNKKVSHIDLIDAYKLLLDDKKSTDLFQNISNNRIRKIIYYVFKKEDHMIEYSLNGHAWENNKMVKTGKEYNR